MKKLFIYLIVLTGTAAFAKAPVDSTRLMLAQARLMANHKSAKYKPQQAFALYNKLAQQGNAEAMNGLGMLYTNGIGVAVNDQEAIRWFERSAKKGYGRAYYNLGTLYKTGTGRDLDLVKAYECFKQGVALNDRMCMYGQGYMLYKGLGCDQNYQQAVAFFKHGASLLDEASFFMLGLCYRNGYGIAVNTDSATYWLKKAALRGDDRAVAELADSTPENSNLTQVPNLQPPATTQAQPVNLKAGYKQIPHHITSSGLEGEYTGYIIKFDWSGKFIIEEAALKLGLKQSNNNLTGNWEEEGQEPVALTGTLTDSAVVFNNTAYNQVDHYHSKNKALPVTFENSHLNLVKNKDTVYLTGTLHLYSPVTKEPQKPEFMMLIRTSKQADLTVDAPDKSKTDSLHFVAYPNPFIGSLQLKYTLTKAAHVSIIVSNINNASIVYRATPGEQGVGDHTVPVAFNGLPGIYSVTLQYGNKVKSAIIYKQ